MSRGGFQPSRVVCGVCGLDYLPGVTSTHHRNRIHLAAAAVRGVPSATLDPQPLVCPVCGGLAGWKGHASSQRHRAATEAMGY
jgi:hypothetical protein